MEEHPDNQQNSKKEGANDSFRLLYHTIMLVISWHTNMKLWHIVTRNWLCKLQTTINQSCTHLLISPMWVIPITVGKTLLRIQFEVTA